MSYKVIHSYIKGRAGRREGGREKEEGGWGRDGEGGKVGETDVNGSWYKKSHMQIIRLSQEFALNDVLFFWI